MGPAGTACLCLRTSEFKRLAHRLVLSVRTPGVAPCGLGFLPTRGLASQGSIRERERARWEPLRSGGQRSHPVLWAQGAHVACPPLRQDRRCHSQDLSGRRTCVAAATLDNSVSLCLSADPSLSSLLLTVSLNLGLALPRCLTPSLAPCPSCSPSRSSPVSLIWQMDFLGPL